MSHDKHIFLIGEEFGGIFADVLNVQELYNIILKQYDQGWLNTDVFITTVVLDKCKPSKTCFLEDSYHNEHKISRKCFVCEKIVDRGNGVRICSNCKHIKTARDGSVVYILRSKCRGHEPQLGGIFSSEILAQKYRSSKKCMCNKQMSIDKFKVGV